MHKIEKQKICQNMLDKMEQNLNPSESPKFFAAFVGQGRKYFVANLEAHKVARMLTMFPSNRWKTMLQKSTL